MKRDPHFVTKLGLASGIRYVLAAINTFMIMIALPWAITALCLMFSAFDHVLLKILSTFTLGAIFCGIVAGSDRVTRWIAQRVSPVSEEEHEAFLSGTGPLNENLPQFMSFPIHYSGFVILTSSFVLTLCAYPTVQRFLHYSLPPNLLQFSPWTYAGLFGIK